MKTLVFCTSYNTSSAAWDERHGMWLRSLRRSELYYDQLLIVDDASPVVPDWGDGLTILEEGGADPLRQDVEIRPVLLYRFRDRLGRQSVFEFPGWHRSFTFGIRYGIAKGFDKIIHIESDAHLTSSRAQRFFNSFQDGWFALWSNKYMMPEIAIQAAAGAGLPLMAGFADRPYGDMVGRNHEVSIPFTHIERQFIGDRHGEDEISVPFNADYTTQSTPGQPHRTYWWIPDAEPIGPKFTVLHHDVETYRTPFAKTMAWGGWSSERDFCWMLDWESVLMLPPVAWEGRHRLRMSLAPCIVGERSAQRLLILVNTHFVKDLILYKQCDISIDLEAGVLSSRSTNVVRFLHPDAVRPSEAGGHFDDRNLSVALTAVTLSVPSAIASGGEPTFLPGGTGMSEIVFIQTSDENVYSEMLFHTSRTVRHFCNRNRFKYEAYIGVKRGYWPYQATFNRIYMLEELLARGFRGWAVYMDADAFIVDLDFDLRRLLEPHKDKAFLATPSGASDEFWDINAGVFIINLAHPTALAILDQWKAAYDAATDETLLACSQWYTGVDDQQMLHQILRDLPSLTSDCARLPWDVINSPDASFIRQHLRAGHETFEARVATIEAQVEKVMSSVPN